MLPAADDDTAIRVWRRGGRRCCNQRLTMLPSAVGGSAGGGRRVLAGPSLDGVGAVVLQGAEGGAASSWDVVLQGEAAELPAGVGMALAATGRLGLCFWGRETGRRTKRCEARTFLSVFLIIGKGHVSTCRSGGSEVQILRRIISSALIQRSKILFCDFFAVHFFWFM